MRNCFHGADILLPRNVSLCRWACIACDQFSSQMEYWERVRDYVADVPSTYNMIYPEALLRQGNPEIRLAAIHQTMRDYLEQGLFETHRRSFIYLERRVPGGIRRGLVGQVDLEEYDFTPGSGARIRATEGTVQERIPPRVKLLAGAALEFPHTIMLCNDMEDRIMQAAASAKGDKVYDFDLMEDGGHITGWAISGLGVSLVNSAVSEYAEAMETQQKTGSPLLFAVGDGNHSLASQKACWEAIKPTLSLEEQQEHPARYALVELENIHDPAITFAPIHRVMKGIEPELLMEKLRTVSVSRGHPVRCISTKGEETIYLDAEKSPLAVAILQPILDEYVAEYGGSMDYIHGEAVVRALSNEKNTLGLILPGMEKSALFPGVLQGGVLPRKTFSMGQAREKRYYLEGKKRL